MKKIAIFAEGQTEQLFAEQIVKCVARENAVAIIKESAHGGGRNKPRTFEISAESKISNAQYYVLIVNCGTDNKVKSDILDRYANLMAAGYEKIFGIRDVYPQVKYEELPRLRSGLSVGIPAAMPIMFILCVMELEAWILAEYTHFPRIHSAITVDRIKSELGVDVVHDKLSLREMPSKDLSDIYWLENIHYDKSKVMVQRILKALDQEHLKKIGSHQIEDLNCFYRGLEEFFHSS